MDIFRKTVKTWPKTLKNFFPNLKAIQFYTTDLEEISSDDLKQFPNLEYLNLAFNLLKKLPGDLLGYTLKLKVVVFHNNKLANVGLGILDGLNSLSDVDFQANTCINLNAQTPDELETLKEELKINCFVAEETTVKPETCPLRCTLNDETDELNSKYDKLFKSIEELQSEVSKMKELNTELQKESKAQDERIDKLEKKVN